MLEPLAMNPLRMVVEASCGETAKHMSDYVEGALSGFRQRRLTRHLARCEKCQAVLRSLRTTLTALRGLAAGERDPDLGVADRVVGRIRALDLPAGEAGEVRGQPDERAGRQ